MKVSYNWLAQYVDIQDIGPYELAEKLTRSGVAVDIVEKRNQGLEKVVIGHVLESTKHPNAEKLNLCTVDVGEGDPLQIICGASNVAKGQKVPVALVGAKLPGGVKIKKAKLRGIESQGMICSAEELGMNEKLLPKDKTEGILVLPEAFQIGEKIEPLLGFDDYVLELDLTPNRSDCLSMIGVAYEVAAILDREVKLPDLKLGTNVSQEPKVKITIEAPEACNHYAARLVTDIKIGESPQWMQNRLIAAGIRPINNVVDVTNYVLLEYGQPLHAFDFQRLEQPNIVVRLAKPNETFVTLDDQERDLDENMLLITDGIKPIAIAGVMGGANSEVTENTAQVLLESAYFNGVSIRRTSTKLGLRSEASMRFEKGVDPNRIYAALNRAAELLEEVAGGTIDGDIMEHKIEEPREAVIMIQPERINQLLGTSLSVEEMKSILKRLRFEVEEQAGKLKVVVPTRRPDITIEADIMEEIARIFGYDRIPISLPEGEYIQGGLTKRQHLRRKIKDSLEAAGLQEVITYTLSGEEQQGLVHGLFKERKPIAVTMPMSEERKVLRTELATHLLETAQYNVNHRNPNVRIYEMGTTFISKESHLSQLPIENWEIAGLLTGILPKGWQTSNVKIDFHYVKGILEDLFQRIGLSDVVYVPEKITGFHPGRTANITVQGEKIGHLGQIHPEIANRYDLEETYLFELDLSKMMEQADTEIHYKPLPKYPAIQRDLAVVVSKDLQAEQLMKTIYESAGDLLESLKLFDVYTSEQLGKDKKSIAFSLTYRSAERTLTDEEVSSLHEQVLVSLKEKVGAELRS